MINGGIPEDVIDNDIDPEVSDAEAHGQYGVRVGDWIALQVIHLAKLTCAPAGAQPGPPLP